MSARASRPLAPGEGVDPALEEAAEAALGSAGTGSEEERAASAPSHGNSTRGTEGRGGRLAPPRGSPRGGPAAREAGGGGGGGKTRLHARIQRRRQRPGSARRQGSDSVGVSGPAPTAPASGARGQAAPGGPAPARVLRRQPSVSGQISEPRPWEQAGPSAGRVRPAKGGRGEALPPQARIVLTRPGSAAALRRLQRGSSLARGLRAIQQQRSRSGRRAGQTGGEPDPPIGVAVEAFGPDGLPGRGSPLEEATPTPTVAHVPAPAQASGGSGRSASGSQPPASLSPPPPPPPPDGQLASEVEKLRERRDAPSNSPVRRSASVQVLQALGPSAAGEAAPPGAQRRDRDEPWRAGVAPYRLAGATPLSGKQSRRTEQSGGAGRRSGQERQRPTATRRSAARPRDKARGTPSVAQEVLFPDRGGGGGGGRGWRAAGLTHRRVRPAGGFPVLPASALLSEKSPSELARALRLDEGTAHGGGGRRRTPPPPRSRPGADADEGEGSGSEDSLDLALGAEGALAVPFHVPSRPG